MLAPSYKEEDGIQEHANIDTIFHIGRHRWDIDRWYFHGILFMVLMMRVLWPNIAEFGSLEQSKKMEVCETYFLMHEQP